MRIAIIGLGLIGGSIGLKLKQSEVTSRELRIIGIPRRGETIREAINCGAIDEGTTDPKEGVKGADLVFICTPISLIISTLKTIAPVLKKGAIVTDVASTKEQIVGQAEKIMPKATFFVGGHPMAGKEKVKLEAAEASLFQDAAWVLTPTKKTNKKALETIKQLVVQLGGKVMITDTKTHDLAVAGISHLPLAVAAALVNTVAEAKQAKEEMKKTAAAGFRDTTRVASGDPLLGVDMFTTNKTAVLKQIAAFKKSLTRLEKEIKLEASSRIAKELEKAKKFRDSIYP